MSELTKVVSLYSKLLKKSEYLMKTQKPYTESTKTSPELQNAPRDNALKKS